MPMASCFPGFAITRSPAWAYSAKHVVHGQGRSPRSATVLATWSQWPRCRSRASSRHRAGHRPRSRFATRVDLVSRTALRRRRDGRLDHGVQPTAHRRTGRPERVAQPEEVALAPDVLLAGPVAPASARRRRTRWPRPRRAAAGPRLGVLGLDRSRPAEHGSLSASRCSRQCPSSWAIVNRRRGGHWRASSALTQISPARREQQTGQRLAVAKRGRARGRAEVLDVAHEQPDMGVGDLLDRDWQRRAVPHVARGSGRGTPRRVARSPPSAAIVIARIAARGRVSARAWRTHGGAVSGRPARPLSRRAIRSTSRQSPACAAWRTSAAGSWASAMVDSGRWSRARREPDVSRRGTARRPRPTPPAGGAGAAVSSAAPPDSV